MAKRGWLIATGLTVAALACGAITLFTWTISETQFDRPDEGFDRYALAMEGLPGVSVDEKARWVEAPTFSDPISWISITVDAAALPGLLDAACAAQYPDSVSWSLRVHTAGANVVTLNSGTLFSGDAGGGHCLDFGFDAAGFVDEIDTAVSGLDVQAAIWDNGRLALVAMGDSPESITALLPLVAHADKLGDAAGLEPDRSVEINAANLSVAVTPDEQERYVGVLSDLAENHGVTSYWADEAGTQVDGVEKVQVVAPDSSRTAIRDAIRASGLRVAGFPVRFIPVEP